MKVKNFTPGGKAERKLLTAMVMNKAVLSRICSRWPSQGGLFYSSGANLLASWCVDHYRQYEDAPKGNIVTCFEQWTEKPRGDEERKFIEGLLRSLSEEYEHSGWETNGEIDQKYAIDLASAHFNRVLQDRFLDKLNQYAENEQRDKVNDLLASFTRFVIDDTGGIHFTESDIRELFSARDSEPLIHPAGGLGKFLQGQLERDAFVGIMAPQKTGKSFWCLEFAVQAVMARRKVTYFQVGDLSEKQIMTRAMVRMIRWPIRSSTGEWPVKVRIPTSLEVRSPTNGPKRAAVLFKTKQFDRPPTAEESLNAFRDLLRKKVKAKELPFCLRWYPVDGISIEGVRAALDNDENNGWVPDVVVIDYADNLAPVHSKTDRRDQINDTWMRMRKLSQERHILLITATQVSARAYENCWVLERKHFADDNRKFNHVTGMLGINQTSAEKAQQVQRLNWVALREGNFSAQRVCWIASCLALARPAVLSHF